MAYLSSVPCILLIRVDAHIKPGRNCKNYDVLRSGNPRKIKAELGLH